MKLVLTTLGGEKPPATVDVPSDMTVGTLLLLASDELGLSGELKGQNNGKILSYDAPLESVAKDGDAIVVFPRIPATTAQGRRPPKMPTEPTAMLAFFDENPMLLKQLHHDRPDLAEAIESKDLTKIRTSIMMIGLQNHKIVWEERKEMESLAQNPDSEESQRKIAKLIEEKNIQENYSLAMDEAPELFGQVHMLYIDIEVNGQSVKAFVDCGAQATIMSAECARRCNLERLIDTRFRSLAKGVGGTGVILGRVHLSDLKIGNSYFGCSFTILDNNDVDFLLGLDMLKRHQCSIDLKLNCLRIGSEDQQVPFLSEKDLPESARDREPPLSPSAAE
eukprot:359493_1